MSEDIKKGLLGIVVDETTISQVMPDINSLTYRGYAVQDLCEKCSFEEVAYLILNKELPNKSQLNKFIKKHDHIMCQKFLPKISNGDKRVFIINGKVCGAISRVPKKGSILSNMSKGAIPKNIQLTKLEKRKKISSQTKRNYLLIPDEFTSLKQNVSFRFKNLDYKEAMQLMGKIGGINAVSYTHLTLPTTPYV